jgi:hypothetical protein
MMVRSIRFSLPELRERQGSQNNHQEAKRRGGKGPTTVAELRWSANSPKDRIHTRDDPI